MVKNNTSATKDPAVKNKLAYLKEHFIGVYNELRKVHWPGRPQMIAYTGVVLFAVTLMAVIIWLFDIGLSFILLRIMELFA